MPVPEWLTLCWNGRPLGRIARIGWVDWPWAGGDFAAGDWPPDLKAAIEWFARHTDSDDEDAEDPPYQEGFYDGWSVVEPDGTAREIGVPKIDFAAGSIEWR